MDVVKVSAKTVEDALTEASIELGTSSDNIEYTVIDEGSKGFFGIGSRKAVIEARRKVSEEDLIKEIFEEKPKKADRSKKENKEYKKDSKKEYKQEKKEVKEVRKEQKKDYEPVPESKKDSKKDSRRENHKDSWNANGKETGAAKNREVARKDSAETARASAPKAAEADSVKEAPSKKNSSKEVLTKEVPSKEALTKEAVSKEADVKEIPSKEVSLREAVPNESVPKKEDGNMTGMEAFTGKEDASDLDSSVDAMAASTEVSPIPKTPADPEEAKSRAISFLKDVLSAMGMNDEITANFEEDTLCVNIEGENMGIMIGKRGQTLDSLQYLTSLVVNKGKSSYIRVKVDTEDYRNRRKATLENLAKNIAFKVKKTGKPVFLEPMNPYERRIIHAALQNDPYVTTHSEGEEPYRKVVITPKKERERDRNHDRGDRRRNYSKYNNRRGRGNRQDYDRDGRYGRGNYTQEYEESEISEVSQSNLVGTGDHTDESEE